MSQPTTAVYAVTDRGARLGTRIAACLGAALYIPERLDAGLPGTRYTALGPLLTETFGRFRAHIFLAACGIAVRVIAPHLRGKTVDPAVVVVDDTGRFAVSLLSGHLGGANDLARIVAGLIGATPVVTTATDAADAPAVELLARDLGLAVDNAVATRRVNAALAAGEPVAVFDPLGFFTLAAPKQAEHFEWLAAPVPSAPDRPLVVVDWRLGPETPARLYLRPPVLVAGVGCRRGTPAAALLELVDRVCRQAKASPQSLGLLASIEAKNDEPGLLEAAATLGVATRFFTAGELAAVPVPHPSAVVGKHMGVESVCEAAAILASSGGRLLVPKTKSALATAALAV
jgi:cobalt-precorrin 5A hydrolase